MNLKEAQKRYYEKNKLSKRIKSKLKMKEIRLKQKIDKEQRKDNE